jgi:hypothetical protein
MRALALDLLNGQVTATDARSGIGLVRVTWFRGQDLYFDWEACRSREGYYRVKGGGCSLSHVLGDGCQTDHAWCRGAAEWTTACSVPWRTRPTATCSGWR